jgi:hypothetical protein
MLGQGAQAQAAREGEPVSEQQVSGPFPARFALAWLFPNVSRMAAEIAAKKQLAERLGIHDEAMRLARTTAYTYSEWVDRLALAVAAGDQS